MEIREIKSLPQGAHILRRDINECGKIKEISILGK